MIVKLLCVVEVEVPARKHLTDLALAQARERLDAFRGAPSVTENMEERGISIYQAKPSDVRGMTSDGDIWLSKVESE